MNQREEEDKEKKNIYINNPKTKRNNKNDNKSGHNCWYAYLLPLFLSFFPLFFLNPNP